MIPDVRVPQVVRVVLDDALEEGEIVEVDGAPDAGGRIDPGGEEWWGLD